MIWWRFNATDTSGDDYRNDANVARHRPMVTSTERTTRRAAAIARLVPVNPVFFVPFLLVFRLPVARSAPTSEPEDASILKHSTKPRPRGWWGPIIELIQREDPSFQPNRDF
jgi:hypothetical protein